MDTVARTHQPLVTNVPTMPAVVPAGEACERSDRKLNTRRALVDAAHSLVLLRGHQKTSIKQITDAAGVGLGTFYNYFATKHHVFEAVVEALRAEFQARLDQARAPLKDPATIVALTTRVSLREALDNAEWHDFLRLAGLDTTRVLLQAEKQRHADIEWGARSGRFKVDDVDYAQRLILGMLEHVVRDIQAGSLTRAAVDDTGRYIMRMLGLPDVVAKALVQSPLPPLAAPARRLLVAGASGSPAAHIVAMSQVTPV